MNLNYEFWVAYHSDLEKTGTLTKAAIERHNRNLTECCWEEGKVPIQPEGNTLHLKVGYPGLLVGLGSLHESGKTAKKPDEKAPPEIKLGFTLDPVTGLPYLPGSTVKGILRSAFLANVDYVSALLSVICGRTEWNQAQLEKLECSIFGKQHPEHSYIIRTDYGIGSDVFLDAWPVAADSKKHLLGLENITPHKAKEEVLKKHHVPPEEREDWDRLAEPNPLTLLKVMPGVVFQFRFLLQDTVLEDGITVTAAQKLELFRQLLLDLGAGAKTNVGFGVLTEPKNAYKTAYYLVPKPDAENPSIPQPSESTRRNDQNRGQERQQRPTKGDGGALWLKSRSEIHPGLNVHGKAKFSKKWNKVYVEIVPPENGEEYGIDGVLKQSTIPAGRIFRWREPIIVHIDSCVPDDRNPQKLRIQLSLAEK